MIAAIKDVSEDSSDSDTDQKLETSADGASNKSRNSVGIFDVNLAEIN